MFGKIVETPQNEKTQFYPRSAYGISKVTGYELTRNYREAYKFFANSGILFNHESQEEDLNSLLEKYLLQLQELKIIYKKI